MVADETFEQSLLNELRAIESFRRRYASEQPTARVDAQDPDVQRLIEVLAFSAVRTRQALHTNVRATWRRLLGSFFAPLLNPLPAMALLQAQVTARMTESLVLPAGTAVQATCSDGFVASFQTLAELRVVPMTLERCEVLRAPQGLRLSLSFMSRLPRADAVGTLRLGLHYLDDYLAALTVFVQLRAHLQRAFVVYDSPVSEGSDGPSCAVEFGPTYDEAYAADERNPLTAVRSFFHFPQQELLLQVQVPPPTRAWTRMTLCFDMSPGWPRRPAPFRELFQPFVVPVSNLRFSPAQPILCDGTQDAYPLHFVHADASYRLHSLSGVYRITADGLVPIPVATLGQATPSYELEQLPRPASAGRAEDETSALILRMPSALLDPAQILVEAHWHQPSLASHLGGALSLTLPDRSVAGIELALLGPVRAGHQPQIGRDASALLRLLSLKMKAVLDLDELQALFSLLETAASGPFRGFAERISALSVEVAPDESVRGAGVRHIYHLVVPTPPSEEGPLWDAFCTQLQLLLDAWNYEGRAEVMRHSDASGLPAGRLRRR
jgi:type VI secretion system protein ImpG